MKKIILVLLLIIMISSLAKDTNYVIPQEAIRLRIIANSNSVNDQLIKNKVKKATEQKLMEITDQSKTLEESRKNIIRQIPVINNIVDNTLKACHYKEGFEVNYGYNYFPKKEHKGVVYQEGEYESLVITLGSGNGDNWWCVLFPPICFIETTDKENIEYKFLIKDLVEDYLNKY